MADFSLSLGRIWGIEIEMHWTFILLLIIASLFGLFTFLFIVVLFVMVVIHELAHSITSKRNNVKVKKIVLLPLGGASIIDLENVKPDLSFRIALAGPLTSIVLALVFGLLAVFTPGGALNQFFQLMFLLNLILGVFNLLPAFPLDGGRVLKSYLEKRYDPFKATQVAVKVSNVMLVLFLFGSVVYGLVAEGLTATYLIFIILWDLILVMFIYGGAQAELQSAYVIKYASTLRVSDAISKNYVLVKPNTSMRQLYETLLHKGTHIVLYQRGGKINAVERIVANPLSKEGTAILDKKVSDYSTEIPSIDYNAPLSKAVEKMRFEDTGVIAVKKSGRLIGVLVEQHVESIIALHLPSTIEKKKQGEPL